MNRICQFLVAGTVATLATTASAHAEPVDSGQTSVNVGPVSAGPVVSQGTAGFGNAGITAAAAVNTTGNKGEQNLGSGLSFTYTAIPDNTLVTVGGPPQAINGVIPKPGTGFQTACPPGQTGYYVYDSTGQFAGVLCVPNGVATATGSAAVIALAQQASSREPWPLLTVSVNPATGITGLQSWFWLAPGNAAMPPASATAGPLTVTVRAALIDVLWVFGDGSRLDSGKSLGQAFPQPSNVRHVYETDTYGLSSGYQAGATLRFGVWYSVNGGPWQFLGTKARSYSLSYVVNQIQPEGVSPTP
jgi:hypothetical protein